jgi:ketosteroid isomerase-like protein
MNRALASRVVASRSALAIFAALAVSTASFAQAPTGDRAADHDALRALLQTATQALNERDFDRIAPSLHPAFTVITVDNRKLVGLDEFRRYWTELFEAPDAVLAAIEARPTADELTRFLDADTGVVYGTSEDTYTFRDGDVRGMATRWSAVVSNEGDGWKLVNVHFSANVLDNPVLDIARSYAITAAALAAGAGLVLGVLLMVLLRRRGRTDPGRA